MFLLFGTVRRYKGARAFIDVFGEHASQHDFLLIAGHARDEDEAAHVEEAAHRDPRIRFSRGFVPLDRTHLFFSAADIVVLPYERITTSGVGPLAMGFGKPLLASDLGCIGEILHDRGGWKVPAGDREALGRALSAASRASAEALDAMGRFNQSASATWTWDRNVDCHVEVYETVLGRVPPARPSTFR